MIEQSMKRFRLALALHYQLLAAAALVVAAASAANAEQCSFNGNREACSLKRIMSNGSQIGTRVTLLSDGKVVTYYFHQCREYPGGEDCKVKIIEGNGRATMGTSSHGGRGTFINSSRGNRTIIPPF